MHERSSELTGLTRVTGQSFAGIEIWHVDLTAARVHLERAKRHLSKAELERASQFRQSEIGEIFIIVRGLLREILAASINVAAEFSVTALDLRFGFGSFGKPFLPDYPEWQFNVAHTRNSALIAVAYNRAVGVDIQWCNSRFDIAKIEEMAFSNSERKLLLNLKPEVRRDVSIQLWTLKEAYAKADGRGLSLKLRDIEVSAALNEPSFPLVWDEGQGIWCFTPRFIVNILNLFPLVHSDAQAAIAIATLA